MGMGMGMGMVGGSTSVVITGPMMTRGAALAKHLLSVFNNSTLALVIISHTNNLGTAPKEFNMLDSEIQSSKRKNLVRGQFEN